MNLGSAADGLKLFCKVPLSTRLLSALYLFSLVAPTPAARFSVSHSSFDGGGGTSWSERFTAESSISPYTGGYISLLNDAPLPKRDFLQLPPNAPLLIPVSTLLTNDLDLEGDSFALSLSSTNTPGGGTLTLVNGVITYTAPANPAPKGDSFSYVLTDGSGASAFGKVVLLSSNSLPRLIGIQGSRTSLVVRFHGLPDTSYLLQSRPNLGTGNSWLDFPNALQPLVEAADANGDFQFEIPIRSANAFFRAADLESLRAELALKRTGSRISMTLRGIPNTVYKLQFRPAFQGGERWEDYPSTARPFIVRADDDGFYHIASPIISSHGFFRTIARE